jgi:hypothetical protein
MARLDGVLKELTRRELEDFRDRIERELRSCAICSHEGARPAKVQRAGIYASIAICDPCFTRFRLPESRAEDLT